MTKLYHVISCSDQVCPGCGKYGPVTRCWNSPDECYECEGCGTVFAQDVDDLDRVVDLDLTGMTCELGGV